MGEEAFKRGSTNLRGDEIGSRAAPSESKESLTLQSRRAIAVEVAVVIVISEGIYLGLPGTCSSRGFVSPKEDPLDGRQSVRGHSLTPS